jgi:hypothetical protein
MTKMPQLTGWLWIGVSHPPSLKKISSQNSKSIVTIVRDTSLLPVLSFSSCILCLVMLLPYYALQVLLVPQSLYTLLGGLNRYVHIKQIGPQNQWFAIQYTISVKVVLLPPIYINNLVTSCRYI